MFKWSNYFNNNIGTMNQLKQKYAHLSSTRHGLSKHSKGLLDRLLKIKFLKGILSEHCPGQSQLKIRQIHGERPRFGQKMVKCIVHTYMTVSQAYGKKKLSELDGFSAVGGAKTRLQGEGNLRYNKLCLEYAVNVVMLIYQVRNYTRPLGHIILFFLFIRQEQFTQYDHVVPDRVIKFLLKPLGKIQHINFL